MGSLELWGGHECTVNRVANRYMDQSEWSGHARRPSDLRLFAELGLKALRYPVLWEKVSPDRPDQRDFTWSDHRLNEIARLGMRPIVGLVHHGSGPRYTSLIDDEGFAPGLAQHARATAERYPWVRDWTPVNEPLTTARFSALYGIWYPHTRNEGAFWRALLNQIDATRLSMREIRRVNPEARLVQTEDLGYCHATPPMRAQAEYENERRWITWDLLCGRVTPEHPLWERLCGWGLEDRLRAIADDPSPPDVLGLNHYLSSERLLDHRVELYPPGLRGGDGPGRYVNIEAVRTVRNGPLGIGAMLRQTWERYGRTIAVTECHNGCTREEQMRWFHRVWRATEAAKADGVDVQAVTAWALLGSYDWHRLLAQETGHYEAGVYDLTGGTPRPTAMVGFLKALGQGREPSHPALGGLGWWEREDRFFEQVTELPDAPVPAPAPPGPEPRPLLLVGGPCARAVALLDACRLRGLAVEAAPPIGGGDPKGEIEAAIRAHRAWAVLHVGSTGETCRASRGAASACGVPVVVWPAGREGPGPAAQELLVETGELISAGELRSFVSHVVEAIEAGSTFRAASNRRVPGACLADAANLILDMLIDGEFGAIRLEAEPGPSWAELAAAAAREADLDHHMVEPVTAPSLRRGEPRAARAAETTDAGAVRRLPPVVSAVHRIVAGHRLVAASRNSCPSSPDAAASEGLRHAAE